MPGMNLKLETYQEEMRDFLLANERAYCTVGLGLGKTASTLSALNELFIDGAIRSALIVAPLRVARMTWPNEIQKWEQFQWMRVEHLRGNKPSQKAQIYLINYERLEEIIDLDFCDVVVFDEITRAKNHNSKRIKTFRPKLSHHRRWGLTGTPRPNSLLEIFSQIRLLDDGERLGANYNTFKRKFFYPTDYMEYDWQPREGSELEIYGRIADLTLVLQSSDYLDIPDTKVEDVSVSLPLPAARLYKTLEAEFLSVINGKNIVASNAAVLVNKLLQVCGGSIYTEDGETEHLHEAKIIELKTLIRRINEPVIVACQYVHEAARVCDLIKGAVHASSVKGNLEAEWNSGRIPVLVSNPASLGHGLNLQQGGRTIIWYSPTWSRELYDQFNGRVARKGQSKMPQIYRLLCPSTMDEVVIESLRDKGEAQSAMLRIMSNYKKMKAAV